MKYANDFDSSLLTAEKFETAIENELKKHMEIAYRTKGYCKGYDIVCVDSNGKTTTVEVKTDFKADKTGNLAIEYESRGQPSGIVTTQADYWALIMMQDMDWIRVYIEIDKLRQICKESPIVSGGDNDTSKMYLVRVNNFNNWRILAI